MLTEAEGDDPLWPKFSAERDIQGLLLLFISVSWTLVKKKNPSVEAQPPVQKRDKVKINED